MLHIVEGSKPVVLPLKVSQANVSVCKQTFIILTFKRHFILNHAKVGPALPLSYKSKDTLIYYILIFIIKTSNTGGCKVEKNRCSLCAYKLDSESHLSIFMHLFIHNAYVVLSGCVQHMRSLTCVQTCMTVDLAAELRRFDRNASFIES